MSDWRYEYEEWKKENMMEWYKTREQALVEAFQGLSLAETVDKLRNIGVSVYTEDGYAILDHPLLEEDDERTYPGTLLKVRGTSSGRGD